MHDSKIDFNQIDESEFINIVRDYKRQTVKFIYNSYDTRQKYLLQLCMICIHMTAHAPT